MRLLVAEDQASIAIELEGTLTEMGHEVVAICTSVERCLDFIRSSGDALDAAVLDVDLNGRNSVPVAEALRAAGVPFIVCTGFSRSDLIKLRLDEPSVEKPYRGEELQIALARLTADRRAKPALSR